MLLLDSPHFLFEKYILQCCSGISGKRQIRHVCLVCYHCPVLHISTPDNSILDAIPHYFIEAAIVKVNSDLLVVKSSGHLFRNPIVWPLSSEEKLHLSLDFVTDVIFICLLFIWLFLFAQLLLHIPISQHSEAFFSTHPLSNADADINKRKKFILCWI